ncbi:dehydrogenase E1 and transketolase domain-containing protein 1 [Flagelloscypha sp. PMI_526]|nr:dehydrogenase E1 and transketolase domain-containing protein 1 [Flagelloscypha sp. PMI_526]
MAPHSASGRVRSVLLSRTACVHRRGYHDESFGFRPLPKFTVPDYTPEQLQNRATNAALLRYLDSIRFHGHRAASIDPLDLIPRIPIQAALDPERYGLIDNNQTYNVDGIMWAEDTGKKEWPLGQITDYVKGIYVGRIAYEFMHSPSKTERLWWERHLESNSTQNNAPTPESKKRILALLSQSEVFDNFLQLKFPNLKRYGLEGGESMLPALDSLFDAASGAGVEQIVLSMPHRGRLNLLVGLLQFEPRRMFSKIKGGPEFSFSEHGVGDVLSHLYTAPTLQYNGQDVEVSLLPNPSHLEAINPVALGLTRAKQFSLLKSSPENCQLGDKVMSVQIHGDASFTGQGVIMEGLGMSNLPHYTSGGTVHLVVDNNIGYTTPAATGRSSQYCSDVAKMINAPVLHVNGDHPEDVSRAMRIAFEYRNHFRKDIVVDLLVYRRWGHNELDLPDLTSPLMYEKIRARKSVPALYEEKLQTENIISTSETSDLRSTHKSFLETELSQVDAYTPPEVPYPGQSPSWKGLVGTASSGKITWNHNPVTGLDKELLTSIGRDSVNVPEGFEVHQKLHRHIKNRLKSLEQGQGIDWATAEAMATGSLLLEGNDVRFSGQDVGRGTFSQRHAMLVNQENESVIVPLNENFSEREGAGRLELANSSLSEMAVLGFEYGASWDRPNLLPIWEAQFGDFFNGAQIIIDTFVSSGEAKWLKQSGLVMLLPHGLDGAGPEHSSSRIERFLQLTDDRYEPSGEEYSNPNMHVVYPTTPAQYYHLLRRQILRNFRKPMIVAAPKGLLRLAAASSSLDEMTSGTSFQPVLNDSSFISTSTSDVKRIVFITGKLYYDILKQRAALNLDDQIALIRIEELCPFPFDQLKSTLEKYPNDAEVIWVQEEPRNQGAWTFVRERLESVVGETKRKVKFVGRKESCVPAPGVGKVYSAEQKAVIEASCSGL